MIARHNLIRWMIAGLLAVLVGACATPAAPAATPAPSAAPAASNESRNITLLLWYGWSGTQRQALGQLVDAFNKQHPDGRISLQTTPLATFGPDLRAALAAGGGPHLVLIPHTWLGDLAEGNILLPLDDLISPAEQEALLPAALEGARAGGPGGARRLYGIPIAFDTLALYYNAANLLAAPETTSDLISSAHGLGAPTASPPLWGLALNLSLDNTIGYLYAFGGQVFDAEGKLALGGVGRAGAEQWLSWLLRLSNDQQLFARPDSSIHVDRELKNSRVLMTFDWAHQIGVYRSLWGQHLGVAPLPRLSETDQPPRPYVKSDVLAVNSRVGTAERRVAIEFLRFMISQDAQRVLIESDIQPARRDLPLDGDTPQLIAARAFRSQAEQGLPMPNSPNREVVWRELKLMQQRVLMGLATPTDAVIEADRRLRERLASPEQQ